MRILYLIIFILFTTSCNTLKVNEYAVVVTFNKVNSGLFTIPEKNAVNSTDSIWYGHIHQTASEKYLYSYQVKKENVTAFRYYIKNPNLTIIPSHFQWIVVKGEILSEEYVQVEEIAHWKEVEEIYTLALKNCNRFLSKQLNNIDKRAADHLKKTEQISLLSAPFSKASKLLFVDKKSNIMGIKCGERRGNSASEIQYLSYLIFYNYIENKVSKVNILYYDN